MRSKGSLWQKVALYLGFACLLVAALRRPSEAARPSTERPDAPNPPAPRPRDNEKGSILARSVGLLFLATMVFALGAALGGAFAASADDGAPIEVGSTSTATDEATTGSDTTTEPVTSDETTTSPQPEPTTSLVETTPAPGSTTQPAPAGGGSSSGTSGGWSTSESVNTGWREERDFAIPPETFLKLSGGGPPHFRVTTLLVKAGKRFRTSGGQPYMGVAWPQK